MSTELNEKEESQKVRECVDCSVEFSISEEDVRFYISKGYFMPKRCMQCLGRRRAERLRTRN